MGTLKRIDKLEMGILPPPDVDKDEWIASHQTEIDAELNRLWNETGPDLERFIQWVRTGEYIPFGPLAGRWCFWVPRNDITTHPIPPGSCETAREIDSAMREYFSPPEGGDDTVHAQPGEAWPVDTAEAVAFLGSHLEPIAGWMTLIKFRESEFFQNVGKEGGL